MPEEKRTSPDFLGAPHLDHIDQTAEFKLESHVSRQIDEMIIVVSQQLSQREPNISKSTIRAFSGALRTLLSKGYQQTGALGFGPAANAFLRMENQGQSTWYQRRSALIYAAKIWGIDQAVCAGLLNARQSIEREPPAAALRRELGFDPIARHKIIQCLNGDELRDLVSTKLARYLILAGTLTGLRPTEWPTARITSEDGQDWLRVRTLQKKPLRFPERRLGIGAFKPEDRELLESTLHMFANMGDAWPKYYELAQKSFMDACEKIWGPTQRRKYNAFNARHQFAANNLHAQEDQNDVIVLLGHESWRDLNRYPSSHLSEFERDWPNDVHTVRSIPFAHPEDIKHVIGRQRGWRKGSKANKNRM